MAQPWKVLDAVETKDGKLELRQRGEKDFLILVNSLVLMNSSLHRSEQSAFDRAAKEYEASQQYNADQPWAYVNLGVFASNRHDYPGAERFYREAIRIDSTWIPAYVDLADLYRAEARDSAAEPLLRKAITLAPNTAEPHYALGLLLVRRQRLQEAIPELRKAAELRPDDQRFQEVLQAAEGKRIP